MQREVVEVGVGNLVATLIGTEYDDDGPILSYYKLAAVDFNGNVGDYAVAPPDVVGVDSVLALSVRAVSPAGEDVSVEIVLPGEGGATLALYDVTGRLVAEREVACCEPGRYTETIAARSELASGVYFVRLEQDGNSRETRVVVVK